MKVYLSKPRYHWVSPYKIADTLCFWREIDYEEPWVRTFAKFLAPVCEAWMKFLDVIHPEIKVVKIDRWDTWSMDSTLTPIILPMLKQLKATKHGSPNVDDCDVPPYLQYKKPSKRKKGPTSGPDVHRIDDNDDLIHRRWDYVLNAMIWSFEQLAADDWEAIYFTPTNEDDELLGGKKLNWNREGWILHNEQIEKGLMLFGKYFRALWD